MKTLPKERRPSRRADSGTITIMAIAMLTALLAMAGLAVDLGFLYTRSRMMYAVADSAVAVGMKDLMAGKTSTVINSDVSDIAGKYGAAYTITTPATTTSQVQVKVQATFPLFFARMLGFPSRQLTVIATGTKKPSPPPIVALGSGCGSGVTFHGLGVVTVHGDVESNGSMNFSTGPTGPDILGNATAGCGVTKNAWDTVTGSVSTGGGFTDPFAPYTPPVTCDYGSTSAFYSIPGWAGPWDMTTTPWTLSPGTYCSNGALALIDPGGGFIATGVTLISVGGSVSIQVTKASIITPNAASPNGIVAYSSTGSVSINGPSGELLTVGGALYAPMGTVTVQQNGPMSMGSIIGSSVDISDFSAWDIGSAGASGNSWQMSQ
jgi:hypothetical protein